MIQKQFTSCSSSRTGWMKTFIGGLPPCKHMMFKETVLPVMDGFHGYPECCLHPSHTERQKIWRSPHEVFMGHTWEVAHIVSVYSINGNSVTWAYLNAREAKKQCHCMSRKKRKQWICDQLASSLCHPLLSNFLAVRLLTKYFPEV